MKRVKKVVCIMLVAIMAIILAMPAFAEEASDAAIEQTGDATAIKAIAAAAAIAVVAAISAIAMSSAISKSAEGIARQPEAGGDIRSSLMLGLVFIETVVIYALIVAILVIFVL